LRASARITTNGIKSSDSIADID